jgi:hypothetical protein
MNHPLQRFSTVASPATMLVAILALVLSAAGAGYAAGTVGTKDLKDGAVTSAKVRDGALRARDLVPEQKFVYTGEADGPVLRDGGEGDCVWRDGSDIIAGLAPVGYRVDRFGTVHLSGVATAEADLAVGDGTCGGGDLEEMTEDRIAFILPRRYWPSSTLLIGLGDGVLITGPAGLESEGVGSLPPGAVYCNDVCPLQGVSYLPAGSPLAATRPSVAPTGPSAGRLLKELGLR